MYVVEELSHHLWLLVDAVQGIDILISGMDSRSFLVTAVERKILFSVLFIQVYKSVYIILYKCYDLQVASSVGWALLRHF